MRRKLFLVAILFSIYTFSQVKDDFSDGDFTRNPSWSGTSDKFQVNKALQLRLNDQDYDKGIAYLTTPSSLIKETEWSFYVHLYFNPTVNNYAKFYLASSGEDLEGEINGYYLLIGGKDKNISLYRQEGEQSFLLIEGEAKMQGKNSPELRIKVTCSESGEWSLYTYLLNEDSDYVCEGKAKDTSWTETSCIGLVCTYTKSRNTGFAFDDILVRSLSSFPGDGDGGNSGDENEEDDEEEEDDNNPINPGDYNPPKLLTILAINDSVLRLTFDEEIVLRSGFFQLDGGITEKRRELSDDKKSINLVFNSLFVDRQEYTVLVSQLTDVWGNRMNDIWLSFIYYDFSLQAMEFGDLVISEIMANPTNAPGLPSVEYVEIYNRTDQPVNLNNWKFYYGMKGYTIKDVVIMPESYLVLCNQKEVDEWEKYNIPVKGITSFPVLANSGKLLWLEDARENVIAWVEYSNTWYGDDFKKGGDFSLECIDLTNLSGEAANWTASMDKSGGTPGRENSVKGDFPDITSSKVAYAYMLASDTLYIHFTKPMSVPSLATIDCYTLLSPSLSLLIATPVLPTGEGVKLAFSRDLSDGEIVELELRKLKDISGYDLEGNLTLKAALSQAPLAGELLFNEILFNPFPGGSDYVEVYNNSEKYIGLNQLLFTSRKEDGSLTEGILLSSIPRTIAPYSYLCFTKDVSGVCSQYECLEECMVSVNKLPSLPDGKGNIMLVDFSGEIIDEFSYTDKIHTSLLDDKEGISLEKVYPTLLSSQFSNWLSASSASNGGTPGYINSQYREHPEVYNEFWLDKKSFSPDEDGIDDLLCIYYEGMEENCVANIKVYDSSGRYIITLANNFRLEENGVFFWNGLEGNGNITRMGLYIIYIETYTPTGMVKRYKLGCALTR